jgi:hypothetical protein
MFLPQRHARDFVAGQITDVVDVPAAESGGDNRHVRDRSSVAEATG